MSKKTLFSLIGIVIVAAIVIVFLYIGKSEDGTENVQKEPQTSGTIPATLPTGKEESQQNIKAVETQIENIIQSPSPQKAIQEGVGTVDFKNAQGKKIPLADFESATDITINKELRDYLDSEDYDMYYCPAADDDKDYAVYFGYEVDLAYVDLYPDTLEWMKTWEKTLLSNLHAVLFPDVAFSAQELNQELKFKDGKFRYAEISLPGSKTGSINYRVSDNGVIVSSSTNCLEKLVEIYEPFQP